MTDDKGEENLQLRNTLEAAVAAAGHELRNALNGLLVNLEVVRSMAQASGFKAEPFMNQALKESEESARLTEAAIVIMKLIAGGVADPRRVTWTSANPAQVGFEAAAGPETILTALQPLADRGVLSIETSGSTVILRIPEKAQF